LPSTPRIDAFTFLGVALAAHHACSGTRAFDPNPVAYAQIGIGRLRDTDRVAIAEIDHDVLPLPPFAVAVLHALAYGSAGKHSGYRRHGLTGAAADLIAQHSACDAADNRAETELMITFERYRVDPRDAALTNFCFAQRGGLAHRGGLRAAGYEQDCRNGCQHSSKHIYLLMVVRNSKQ
jgi:hypothetical protein